jgi:hypothetical protein
MHITYTQVWSLVFARRSRQAKPLQILKRGSSGSTTMATTPPVGSPLSASPAATDPGLPSGAPAQASPAPGPPSDPAAQKNSTEDDTITREYICSCFSSSDFQ